MGIFGAIIITIVVRARAPYQGSGRVLKRLSAMALQL